MITNRLKTETTDDNNIPQPGGTDWETNSLTAFFFFFSFLFLTNTKSIQRRWSVWMVFKFKSKDWRMELPATKESSELTFCADCDVSARSTHRVAFTACSWNRDRSHWFCQTECSHWSVGPGAGLTGWYSVNTQWYTTDRPLDVNLYILLYKLKLVTYTRKEEERSTWAPTQSDDLAMSRFGLGLILTTDDTTELYNQ